jgi:hypothetical protein
MHIHHGSPTPMTHLPCAYALPCCCQSSDRLSPQTFNFVLFSTHWLFPQERGPWLAGKLTTGVLAAMVNVATVALARAMSLIDTRQPHACADGELGKLACNLRV